MLLRHMPSTFLRCAVATALLPVAPALGAEGGPNVGDIGQAVAAILIFLLLLAVLGRWAWKPIVHQLHSREESIARAINDAQRRDQESQELLKLYRNRLDCAEAEVAEILASGRKEAAVARDQILQAASDEARKSASAARQEIDQARRDAARLTGKPAMDLALGYSTALNGYVLVDGAVRWLLPDTRTEARGKALPAFPLSLLKDVDRGSARIQVDPNPPAAAGGTFWDRYPIEPGDGMSIRGQLITLTPAQLPEFLNALLARKGSLERHDDYFRSRYYVLK